VIGALGTWWKAAHQNIFGPIFEAYRVCIWAPAWDRVLEKKGDNPNQPGFLPLSQHFIISLCFLNLLSCKSSLEKIFRKRVLLFLVDRYIAQGLFHKFW